MCQGFSHSYPCLLLKSSNSGWHGHWFYIWDVTATPLPPFFGVALVRLPSWNWGCDKTRLLKVTEILEILEDWVSAGLDGVTVLRTMVERQVQPLKQWATLLCDYSRGKDPTRETMDMLEVSEVTKRVEGLVSFGTVVMTKCAVEAFSVNF